MAEGPVVQIWYPAIASEYLNLGGATKENIASLGDSTKCDSK